jgi:hypothetical protein
VHAPIQHGDLLRGNFGPADCIVIIDGYYYNTAPVRHKEILAVLAAGATVIGCASMGAIRASELHHFGMQGVGRVFELYRDGVIDGDDEVAVLHDMDAPYKRTTEPLVNIRCAAANLFPGRSDLIGPLISCLRNLPFSARSWKGMEEAVRNQIPWLFSEWSHLHDSFRHGSQPMDIKEIDARAGLAMAMTAQCGIVDRFDWCRDRSWRTSLLGDWEAHFRGLDVADVYVSQESLLRYQQIYSADFPFRWSSFVHAVISSALPADLEALSDLTDAQQAHWLTLAERESLPPQDRARVILSRSFRPRDGVAELASSPLLMSDIPAVAEVVAEACALNEVVREGDPRHDVRRIDADALAAALAALWDCSMCDSENLDALARDRGFPEFAAAAEAYRTFYLRDLLLGNETEEACA